MTRSPGAISRSGAWARSRRMRSSRSSRLRELTEVYRPKISAADSTASLAPGTVKPLGRSPSRLCTPCHASSSPQISSKRAFSPSWGKYITTRQRSRLHCCSALRARARRASCITKSPVSNSPSGVPTKACAASASDPSSGSSSSRSGGSSKICTSPA